MNYPNHLLPSNNYKTIDWTDDLLPLYLIRHTSKNSLLPGTNRVNPDTIDIPSDNLSDLSTNLLGNSKIDDVYIKVINQQFLEPWYEGNPITIPAFDLDFQVDKERGYYFWLIHDIIACHFEPTEIIIDNQTFSFTLSLEVKHTPNKCNFWHFSIITFADNNNVALLQISKNQKKKLWRTAKIRLTNFILDDVHNFSSLPSKHYNRI